MVYVSILFVVAALGLYLILLGVGYLTFPRSLSWQKPTVYVGVLLLFLVADIGGTWGYFHTPTPQQAVKKVVAAVLAKGLAYNMRAHIGPPTMTKEPVLLQDAESDGDRLIYKLTFSAENSEQFLESVKNIKDDIQKNGCNRAEYKALLHYGITIELDYSVPGSWGADPIVITPESCNF